MQASIPPINAVADDTPAAGTPMRSDHPSRRFWDRMARKYATNTISDMPGYERSLEATRALLGASDHVLEIGCGTGTTALQHAPYVAQITGTDIAPEMIAIAGEKRDAAGLANAQFRAAPADALPFGDGAFDAAMGHNLYHLVDDVDGALVEAARVIRRDGLFITKTPCLGDMNIAMRTFVLPVMRRWFGIPVLQIFTVKDWQAAIERAGFRIETAAFHDSKGRTRPFIVARKL